MRSPIKVSPVAVTIGGLLLLWGSWACHPKAVVTPALPSPSPLADAVPAVAPTPGKVYTYRTTRDGVTQATHVYTVKAYAGDALTFDVTVTPSEGAPTTRTGVQVTRANGVFWTLEGPSPVTADIATYPTVKVTIPALGEVRCWLVESPAATFNIVEGVIVQTTDKLTRANTVLEAVTR